MSLLDEAKKKQVQSRGATRPGKEDIELALAWARGEIGITQVQAAYKTKRKMKTLGGSNMYLPLARALREYIITNKI